MATYSAIIDNGLTSAEGFNKGLSQLIPEGIPTITTPTSLQVVQRGAGANMSVDISIGSALISNTTNTFSYAAWQDAVSNLAIGASSPSNPRIDAVVAYINLSAVSTTNNNNPGSLTFADIQGTPAGSPTAPSDSTVQSTLGATVPWVRLANVTVPTSATQIVTANIADVRPPYAVRANLWGGSSNTFGHTVPNVADDTVQLLNAAQSPTNKTISGTTNKVRAGGANSSLVDSNSIQIDEEKQRTEHEFNYVASGCVWSGDSYGSTLNASMTSGVIYISGRRLTVATITAHAFTASKDTYVDFADNGDGTARVIYTEATNNAASPSTLSDASTFADATNIRNAIIVSGASNIASAGSVNQGQETKVLPIASSVAYSVTDSLGNLICPRDPSRKILGYRQITSTFTGSGFANQQVTGLTCPVIVPTGRKVRITTQSDAWSATTFVYPMIWDGTVGSGTELGQEQLNVNTGGQVTALTTPSTASKTYNAGVAGTSGTVSCAAGSADPAFILVELV